MVESADLRQRNDLTMRWRLDSTRFRRVFVESEVRARAVIVADVIAKTTPQVSLVEDDDVVEEFASDGTDHALGEGFCHGERCVVRTSAMPMLFARRRNSLP